jgi:hypothetical protein
MATSMDSRASGKASARTSKICFFHLNTPNTKRLDLYGRGVFVWQYLKKCKNL